MSTKNVCISLLFVLFFLPVLLKAQWGAVRFDEYNTFYKVHAPTANTVFVTGTEPMNNAHFIMRTNDAGNTWDSIPVNTVNDTYYLSEVFFVDASVGFVGGTKNNAQVLMKTTDNGMTWNAFTPNPSGALGIRSVYFTDTQNGFATDGSDFFRTTDGGTTWATTTPSFNVSDIFFADANNGYASGQNGAGVVMKTSDGGQTWNPSLSIMDSLLFVSQMDELDFVSPTTGFTYLVNTNKLYTTSNGGTSWNEIVVDSVQFITDVDFISADTGRVLSLEGKIFATNDGGQTWALEYATDWGLYGPLVYLNSLHFVGNTGFVTGSKGLIKKYTPIATGIDVEPFAENISVFPNPFSTAVTFQSIGDVRLAGCELMIFDLAGRAVYQQTLTASRETIHLGLPSGMYAYTVTSGRTSVASGRVVVQ